MATKKPAKKAAPVAAPKKPSRSRSAKATKAPAKPKLSIEDRVKLLEDAGLANGWHLPHAYPNEPAEHPGAQ
jgi:hypothetical protein